MSRLELAVAPGLSFHFAAQPEALASEIASYLGSGDGGDRAGDTVVVVEASAPPSADDSSGTAEHSPIATAEHSPGTTDGRPEHSPGTPPEHSPGTVAGSTVAGSAGTVVVAEEGLEVRRVGRVTTFERKGIVGWLDAGSGRGGISADAPSRSAARDFVSLALAPLLIELAEPRGWLGLHAAAVAVAGRGILLPGASGAGKSTIFRNCRRAGLDVLSDDLVWLTAEPAGGFSLRPFPRGFATRDEERPVPPPTLWRAPVAAIVCPTIADRDSSRLEPLSPARTLDVLLAESGFLRPAAGDRFRALVRLAGAVPCYRLQAGRRRDDVPALLATL